MHSGPLQGVKVIDFSIIYSGPFAGIQLADLGAEVLKVEPLEGDQIRGIAAVVPGRSKQFQWMNRGKKSIELDLQDPRGREIAHKLVAGADVVLVNYRPGVPERLGIDYETLSKINPRLIYGDIIGFGREGPMAKRAASDIVGQAYAGAIAVPGQLDEVGAPLYRNLAIADLTTGLVAAMGMITALYDRERTGKGQLVTVSLLRTVMGLLNSEIMRESITDASGRDLMVAELERIRAEGGSYDRLIETRLAFSPLAGAMSLYFTAYRASDGGIVIGALTRANRDALRAVIGVEGDPSDDEGFDPLDAANEQMFVELKDQIRAKMLTKTVDEWVELFEQAGAPAGAVRIPEEMSDDPQGKLHMQEIEDPVTGLQRQVRPIFDLSESPTSIAGPAPLLGADADATLDGLGYSADEIATLREDAVIGRGE